MVTQSKKGQKYKMAFCAYQFDEYLVDKISL